MLILVTFSLFSETREIRSLNEISPETFSEKTLVMFSIDDVLIYPKDALMQHWRSDWQPEGVRTWTDEEDTIAWMGTTFQLMDPDGPKLIDRLYQKGIPTIGFTSFAMDQGGLVASIPQWRSEQLEELGIHFKGNHELFFTVPEGFIPPSFENGILYCGDYYKKDKTNKGKILALYLDSIDWTPECIVLVDAGKKHLISVEEELSRRGIPFLGFYYLPKEYDLLDEKIAEMQYKMMIEQKKWLSDQEAKTGKAVLAY